MVLKFLGCIMLLAATTSTGFMLSRRLSKRRDFLKAFIAFINSVTTNIRYSSADIFTVITSSANSDSLLYFAIDTAQNLPFEAVWKDKIDNIPKHLSLTEADKKLLYEFGTQLGKTDVDGQMKHLELYKISFTKQLSFAEEAIKQKSKLYKSMGFFAGAAIALMMI